MDFSNLTNQDFRTLGAIGAYTLAAGSLIIAAAQSINVRSMRKLVKAERGARSAAEDLTATLTMQIATEQEKSSALDECVLALRSENNALAMFKDAQIILIENQGDIIAAKDGLVTALRKENTALSEVGDALEKRNIMLNGTVTRLQERNYNQAATIKEYADKAAARRAKLSEAGRKGALVANPKRKKGIDWTKPLETNERKPRALAIDGPDNDGTYWVYPVDSLDPNNEGTWLYPDGSQYDSEEPYYPMGIRNVRAPRKRVSA